MAGIIGRKIGMSSFYDGKGKNIPCTMVEAGPCIVTQIKDIDTELQYSDWSEGVKAQLQTYKDELFAVRSLPGTYDELFNTANTTREAFAALTNFQFRFEA